MKAFLMYKAQDFDLQQKLPPNAQVLTQDLELQTLFNAMALGDKFVFEVVKRALLSSVTDLDTIHYRQHILQDCLKNPSIVRDIYVLAVEAIENERRNFWGLLSKYPTMVLHRSLDVMQMFVGMLSKLKRIADEHADAFESESFTRLFEVLKAELGDDYFASVQQHLKALKFRDGVLMSAELGQGNQGIHYILRKPHDKKQGWVERIFAEKPLAYRFTIDDRDESGARALSDLKDRGINLVANALTQSAEHILSFFSMLRTELAFYMGCLNLQGQLVHIGEPLCFPMPVASCERRHKFDGLYDVCLALTTKQGVIGNNMAAEEKDLVLITGANQGGKSTFLRSVGLAQIMMQCGMFVPAESFYANVCESLFTHFKRKEDARMTSGKLDEELSRMSAIVDNITANSMILFNESFAATNEREGSEIARQIICALLEQGIKVFFVTHLYEFAHGFYNKNMQNAMFLRAERQADGKRTFKLIEGEPLQTSYGQDVFHQIFSIDV